MPKLPLHEVRFCCDKFADAAYSFAAGMKAEGLKLLREAGDHGCRPLRAHARLEPITIEGLRRRKRRRPQRRGRR